MTAAAIAISLITVAFLNGLQNDVVGASCGQRFHRAQSDRIGPPGKPEDWPNDGPGAHNRPKNYDDRYDDSDDYFIGAE